MLQPTNVEHVMEHIAADLCTRYPEVACERIEAIVQTHYQRLAHESGDEHHHPEFLGALVEHAAKEEIHEIDGAPRPATGVTA